MKTSFPGYYRPSDEEFLALWQTATFALDANVLLNMYGYSRRTRNSLLSLFRSIEERLWVPYQFAKEYQKNRFKSIAEQVTSYSAARKELKTLLDQRLRVAHKHPFVGKASLENLERICRELEQGEREYERLFSTDPHFAEISRMLSGRVGTAPTEAEFSQHCAEARVRYANKTPPGYIDSVKPEPQAFGDYFGWKEILLHGEIAQCATILITDDRKEDWWHVHGKDRRIGPRPELVAEYWGRCQKPFYMYTLEEFMRYAQRHLGQRITTAALQEVRERSASQTDDKPLEKATGAKSDSKPLTLEFTSFSAFKSEEHPEKPDSEKPV